MNEDPRIYEIHNRIGELLQLEDGWLDGEDGKALCPQLAHEVRELVCNLMKRFPELPRPSLYMTPEGGIELEYHKGEPFSAYIDFLPDEPTDGWEAFVRDLAAHQYRITQEKMNKVWEQAMEGLKRRGHNPPDKALETLAKRLDELLEVECWCVEIDQQQEETKDR